MHQAIKWIIGAGAVLAAHGGASAQNAQPSPPPLTMPPAATTSPGEVRGPFPAPVGHRQPRQSDLPQDVVRKENSTPEQNTRGFDDSKLRICKGC
jgi:hypothetical protein